MGDQTPSAFSGLPRAPHPVPVVACSGGACLECDNCQTAAHQLHKLKRDVSDIQSSLENLSRFEQDLRSHIEPLEARVMAGNIRPDQVCALLAEPRFVELIRAVKQFKLQLPFTSYFDFSVAHDENPRSTNRDIAGDSDPEALQLESKYYSLTPEEKKCVCYLSVFDAEIKKREIINWWIGEGLLPDASFDPDGRVKKVEQVGEELLQLLQQKQFIRRLDKKKRASDAWLMEKSVRTFLRSKAKAKAKEENLFDFDQKILSEKFMLLRSDNQIDSLLDAITADQVKTVFNVDRLRIGESEARTLGLMKSLQVLHLGRSQPKQHIQVKNLKRIMKRLKKMKNLRLLSLQGISSMKELSECVSTLKSLKVLDLRSCLALESLPSSIGDLKNLTHLDMSGCYILLPLPKGLSLLSNLEVLKGFVIGDDESPKRSKICSLGDLWLLKKLHKLSILVSRKDFPQRQDLKDLANIEGLVTLKILWKLASEQDQENALPGQNEQGQESPDPVQNEQFQEEGVSVQNELSGEQATLDENKHHQGLEGAHLAPNVQVQVNAEQALNLSAVSLRHLTRTVFTRCFRNPVEKEVDTEVLKKLKKLDLWYAPEEAGSMLLAPENFTALNKLYIRWAKFQHLIYDRDAESENKWGVKTLCLLSLPKLEMSWEDLNDLFPVMSYLEVQDCNKLQFSQHLDEEGVWRDQIS